MSEHFEYFNSPETTFNVLGDVREAAIYDAKHNTITFHDIFEVENKTGHTVDDVVVVLPYVWAVVPPPPKGTESPIGDPGFVALDFEDGAWTAENFNDVEGLDLKVTAEIVPSRMVASQAFSQAEPINGSDMITC